jgi:hypothetical protein
MLKPIHTHKTSYYEVLRPCLWFATEDKVPTEKFMEYYTLKAINSLLHFEFIKLVIP